MREAAEPLPFAEILERVNARASITTRDPKATIRGALGQTHTIVATGDARYGWKPRLVNGSTVRLTLPEGDWRRGITIGDEARDLLWPTFLENQKRRDVAPVTARLPDGGTATWPLEMTGGLGGWGTTASPEFWRWFDTLDVRVGDHLIVTALDGEARIYAVAFEPRRARDEAAIQRRNQAVVQAALDFLRSKAGSVALWDITEYLVATGRYRDPVPPDPLAEIWTSEAWEPVLQARGGMRDHTGEIGSPWSEAPRHTHQVTLADLDLQPRGKLLYLFDYGDNHEFDVRVKRVNPSAPAGTYPRVVASQGDAPEQYPSEDEEWRW